MAHNFTNTYGMAKHIYQSLELNANVDIDIEIAHIKIFRKHLSEIVRRQKSSNKYITRMENGAVRVYRFQ